MKKYAGTRGWLYAGIGVLVLFFASQAKAATAYFVRSVDTGSTKQCIYRGPISRTYTITVDWIRPCPRSITVPDMF